MVAQRSSLGGVAAPSAPPGIHREDAFSSDQKLMQAVADGDAAARCVLAKRLVNRTRKIARALLGGGADADDAAQQALVEILAAARTYRAEAPLEAWSKRITIRVCLKAARARGPQGGFADVGIDALPSDFGAVALHEHLPRPVQAYLDLLPDSQREALVLRYSLELGLAEIAERTGASMATVRYRLWTGLKKMRGWIRRDVKLAQRGAEP